MREILYKYVPKSLIDRPKSGFGIPLDDWLRGPLKSWVSDLLNKENIDKSGYLNYETISNLWNEHLTKDINNSSKLWPILMWQSWLENL